MQWSSPSHCKPKMKHMNFKEMQQAMSKTAESTFKLVNNIAKVERLIAIVLIFTPLILYLADFGFAREFRSSISNYAFMCDSYWFGSLLAVAGTLFILNGAQHMRVRNTFLYQVEKRFGKGYNIIFGLALFGVIYFDHINYTLIHFIFAGVFYIGCAIAMIFLSQGNLKNIGRVLGIFTLMALILHFVLDTRLTEDRNPFTLLWAEWVGLLLIAIYFVLESYQRDKREKENNLQPN